MINYIMNKFKKKLKYELLVNSLCDNCSAVNLIGSVLFIFTM